jgi:hypothetical protein
MSDFYWAITTYRQRGMTEAQIQLLRSYDFLNDSWILVVSTSEVDLEFKALESIYDKVKVVEFFDAPGNVPGFGWDGFNKDTYLPCRILHSLEKCFEFGLQNGLRKFIHTHSDTFCLDTNWIKSRIDALDRCLVAADLSYHDEANAQLYKTSPQGVHIHPTPIGFNIPKCANIGYNNFSHIYKNNSRFGSHTYTGTEGLLGAWLHYCLTGRNILGFEDTLDPRYIEAVNFSQLRSYHGFYRASGILNLPGKQ